MTGRLLFVATSADSIGTDAHPTGLWLEELAAPYFKLKEAGYDVEVASPRGGQIPLDPKSIRPPEGGPPPALSARFLGNPDDMRTIQKSLKVAEVSSKADDYAGIYVPGGHGAMVDLPDDKHLQQLLADFMEAGKVVGSVCHGPAAFVNVKLRSGDPMVKDKKVTSFSNAEEKQVGLNKVVPFLLEDKLKERSAHYSSTEPWKPHVVSDGNLVTGQNPASSEAVAEGLLKVLRK